MAKPIHPTSVNLKVGHTLYLITSNGEPLPNGNYKVYARTLKVGSHNTRLPIAGEHADILPVNYIKSQLLNNSKKLNYPILIVKDSLFFSRRRALAKVERMNRC